MACCAFVVFVIGQIYVVLEIVAKAMGFRLPGAALDAPNPVDWRPGLTAIAAFREPLSPLGLYRPARLAARMVAGLVVSVAALSIALIFRPAAHGFDIGAYLADPAHWCRSAHIVSP